MAAKDRLSDIAAALLRGGRRRVVSKRLGRYLDAEVRRRIPSQVSLPCDDAAAAAEHIDVVAEAAAPVELHQTAASQAISKPSSARALKLLGFAPVEAGDDDDVLFEQLKAQKNWI